MRTFPGSALVLGTIFLTLLPSIAQADDYIINQNQTGIALPGVALPNGYDEVRAADGTTCRSAVGGNGAYIDSGIIGGGLSSTGSNSISAYGRVVVPLGERKPRLNCNELYRLELERLQFEVQMLRRGLDPRLSQQGISGGEDWDTEGWTTDGRSDGVSRANLVP